MRGWSPRERGGASVEGESMDKNILEQYADLIAEREDLKKRIQSTERKISLLCEDMVADTVTLGKHGKKPLGRKVIRGTPTAEIDRKRKALQRYKLHLKEAEFMIDEMISDAQKYINEIDDSRVRRIFQYRYIDKLTWVQVAIRMGKHHTPDSCRMTAERYLHQGK